MIMSEGKLPKAEWQKKVKEWAASYAPTKSPYLSSGECSLCGKDHRQFWEVYEQDKPKLKRICEEMSKYEEVENPTAKIEKLEDSPFYTGKRRGELMKPKTSEWVKRFEKKFAGQTGYCNPTIAKEIEDFIRQLLATQREELVERTDKAVEELFKTMNDRMFDKTVKGKGGWWDVSQKDWDDSSFTMDEMKKILKKYLIAELEGR